ncbi:GDP/GTP exchange factor Sec2p-domain-containing protein [Phycomyces nitens]|nr:GDP/GTP exchange factor Sec2p-domain-containing protein [Phycomyces nitens]
MATSEAALPLIDQDSSAQFGRDATNQDIANLYSRLQTVMDKTHEPANAEAKFIPLPPSLPLSPSTSSPTAFHFPPRVVTPRTSDETQKSPVECPCHFIISETSSNHCSLCNRAIPVIDQLYEEQKMYEEELADLQNKLAAEQAKISEQLAEIDALSRTLEDVEQRLDAKSEEFAALQGDMELLNDKYVDEIERVAEIQHSKDMVESELEDLSRRLFEEANGMVANEKREKYNLEMAQKHLENQLKETQERLGAEQMQLKELRLRMEDMVDVSSTDTSSLDSPKASSIMSSSTTTVTPNSTQSIGVDPILLEEFGNYVRTSSNVALKKLHTIPFMRNCQTEDVEPCLRFGPASRLSAHKINDAIVLNTCFIEEAPFGFAAEQASRPLDVPLKISASKTLIWERFSSSNANQTGHFTGCQACGRPAGPLPYRFRISFFDDWACIDRYCRDRLVAVCEFYVFLRNVRQGLYSSRALPDLYHEAMRLRLQMFYARMGALPWSLRHLNIKHDELGPLPGPILSPPPVSESSPLPRKSSPKHLQYSRHSVDAKAKTETRESA